jgi:V8-like Glu-specific endopeptidase
MSYNQTVYPYDTVVYITDTIGDEEWQGSGVLIGPEEVLTASHVVYHQGVGTAENIVVSPAYGVGGAPFGSASGVLFDYNAVDDAGDLITGDQSQYDFALIKLSQPFASLGTMSLLPGFAGGNVNVTGYPATSGGAQVTNPETVTADPYYTLLDGTALGPGSSGGPVWVETSSGPAVVGVVSSADNGAGSTGYNAQITAAAYDEIESWLAQDESPSGAGLAVLDTSTNQLVPVGATPYAGPVAGLQEQFVDISSDNLNVTASTPNWFIHTGPGTDAIAVTSGNNVLDGGTGSNFLVGGSGSDTFFVDDRGATAAIWSTVSGFNAGDSATVWGVVPADFTLHWVDGQGASGYTGLTLHAESRDGPTASLTLAGYSTADLANGTIGVTYGTDAASGSPFMFIHAYT